jgi:copper transport protein
LSALRRRWWAVLALVVALVGGVAAGTAFAHAELVASNPANQAILATQPEGILLTFSESVDPVGDSIRLVDAAGNAVPLGPVDQGAGDDTLRAVLPGVIDDGTYVVGWQAISADSHKIRGAFTFSIGAATPTEPGVLDDIFASGDTSRSDSLVLGAGRFMSFAAIGVLLGGLFLAAVLVPELLGTRRLGRLLIGAAVVAEVGTLVMLVAQAHLIAGSFLAVGDVLDTQAGRWWLARILAVGLFALFIPMRAYLGNTPGRVEAGLAAVVVLGVVAAGGHAVAGSNVVLGFGATVVHLAAMSIWLGGLMLLALGVPRDWFWWTASRFSPWALGSVVALAATGSVNAWRQLGSLSGLTDSAYGRWLLIKLLLVVVVVVIAAFSRRMAHSDDPDELAVEEVAEEAAEEAIADEEVADATDGGSEPTPQYAPPALRRTVVLEIVGMGLILMATAGLVNSPPPPSAATTESASVVVGDRIMQLELEPAVTGGTEMHVYLTSPSGGLDTPDEITVTASLPTQDLGPLDIETVPGGPNHVIGYDVNLPVAGLWTFDVTARFGEFDQQVFTVQIPVTD